MVPMGESSGEMFVQYADGSTARLCEVRNLTSADELDNNADNARYASLYTEGVSFTCTLKFVMKHRKGYLDLISGNDTTAARRFIRSSRRWKEQNRRKKLKEGKQ